MNNSYEGQTFWNRYGQYLLLATLVFVVPAIFSVYERSSERESFRERLSFGTEACLERAKHNGYPEIVCLEIEKAAAAAYAPYTSGASHVILQGLIFGFFCGFVSLRQKVSELEKRLNA